MAGKAVRVKYPDCRTVGADGPLRGYPSVGSGLAFVGDRLGGFGQGVAEQPHDQPMHGMDEFVEHGGSGFEAGTRLIYLSAIPAYP